MSTKPTLTIDFESYSNTTLLNRWMESDWAQTELRVMAQENTHNELNQ